MNEDLVVGRTYRIVHSRKGEFVAKLIRVGGGWADVEIVSGSVRGVGSFEMPVGETISVRLSFCKFDQTEASES